MNRYNKEGCVYVVDDDPTTRKEVHLLLEIVGLEVKAFSSGNEFLEENNINRPACLLLDIRMPGISGLEVQKRLMQNKMNLPILFLSAYGDIPSVIQAFKSGAFDFIEKPFSKQVLIDRIQQAIHIDRKQHLIAKEKQKIQKKIKSLTEQQKKILMLVIQGKSSRQIADYLEISPKTVEVHRTNILEKMGVRNSIQLTRIVLWADQQIIESGPSFLS